MGPLFSQDRLQDTVHRTTAPVSGPNLFPTVSKSAVGRRSCQPPSKRGSGGNSPGKSRVLFTDFPCSKKEWKSKADYRPVNSQSTCFHSKLQNGNSEKSQECYTSQQLGIFVGPDRCVFACPDSSTVTQISSVHSEWQGVPFQSPPVLSLNESLRFHAPYDGHCDASKEKGNNNASISRRLVTSEPKSSNSVGTQTLHYESYNIPRSDYQLPEIRPHSYSNFHFHRDGISNLFQHCQSSTSKSSETIGNNHDHLSENIHISQSFPFSFGTTQCSSGFCNARQTTSPTIANVPALSMETTKIFTESPNQDISEHFTPSRLVEAGRDLSTRSALEDKSPLTHNIYGPQPLGLGFTCGTGRTTVSWSLDGNPISALHKYAGNDGHFNGTKGSSSHNQEFHRVSLHRQHNSSGLSEKTRGDPFSRPLFKSLGNPELVLSEQDSASRKTRSGEIQHSGRQALKS